MKGGKTNKEPVTCLRGKYAWWSQVCTPHLLTRLLQEKMPGWAENEEEDSWLWDLKKVEPCDLDFEENGM